MPKRKSFLEEFKVVTPDPGNLYATSLKLYDEALKRKGIRLRRVTGRQFAAMNKKISTENPGSWRPMLRNFDPAFGYIDESRAFFVLGDNEQAGTVVAHAVYFKDLRNESLHEQLVSMKHFHRDPVKMRYHPDELVTDSTRMTKKIKGRVAWTGAHWTREEHRWKPGEQEDNTPVAIMTRMAKILALASWENESDGPLDWFATVMALKVFLRNVSARAGYEDVDGDINFFNLPIGSFPVKLLYARREKALREIRRYNRRLSALIR